MAKRKKISSQKACLRKNRMTMGLLNKGFEQDYPNMLKELNKDRNCSETADQFLKKSRRRNSL